MSLKKSHGNMYDWVTHMHSHIAGKCSHECSYCYVQKNRFGVSPRYQGEARLVAEEFSVKYGKDKIIFIEHMNDMFAEDVKDEWIKKILFHCCDWQDNQYVFQTKNPLRALEFEGKFPEKHIIGTTIETNRSLGELSKAPNPHTRYTGIYTLMAKGSKTFITIEPILDFDVEVLSRWIIDANPDFINIGADSKRTNLPEPSPEKIKELIKNLQEAKINIKKKINLGRLLTNPTQG